MVKETLVHLRTEVDVHADGVRTPYFRIAHYPINICRGRAIYVRLNRSLTQWRSELLEGQVVEGNVVRTGSSESRRDYAGFHQVAAGVIVEVDDVVGVVEPPLPG